MTAFRKFADDDCGEFGLWQFMHAWCSLGLPGTENEIQETFTQVDTNNSGTIGYEEFRTAIRSNRLAKIRLKHFFVTHFYFYASSTFFDIHLKFRPPQTEKKAYPT